MACTIFSIYDLYRPVNIDGPRTHFWKTGFKGTWLGAVALVLLMSSFWHPALRCLLSVGRIKVVMISGKDQGATVMMMEMPLSSCLPSPHSSHLMVSVLKPRWYPRSNLRWYPCSDGIARHILLATSSSDSQGLLASSSGTHQKSINALGKGLMKQI